MILVTNNVQSGCFVIPVDQLPFCLRILLEQCVRRYDGVQVTSSHVCSITRWQSNVNATIPFCPARVIFQDFTYVAKNIIISVTYTQFLLPLPRRICFRHCLFVCLSVCKQLCAKASEQICYGPINK